MTRIVGQTGGVTPTPGLLGSTGGGSAEELSDLLDPSGMASATRPFVGRPAAMIGPWGALNAQAAAGRFFLDAANNRDIPHPQEHSSIRVVPTAISGTIFQISVHHVVRLVTDSMTYFLRFGEAGTAIDVATAVVISNTQDITINCGLRFSGSDPVSRLLSVAVEQSGTEVNAALASTLVIAYYPD